jgi:serine/threonine-protein kinase HipA
MHPASDVPKLVALPKLLYAAERFSAEEDESSISYLLDAGSASLGGARPKASVTDNGKLLMAKFPHRQDEWDVMGWEWVMLEMAGEFHIRVPAHKLVPIDGRNVLITERFDRDGDTRIGYISAMTLLGLEDGERADYADIALGLRDVSVSPKDDLEELFRRIVFSIFVNNTDDHLRNHGFIRSGSGWRLSPLFDVNPNPVTSEQRVTSLFGETQRALALDALRAFPGEFGLKPEQAETIIREAAEITNAYTAYADKAGIPASEQERFQFIAAKPV